MGNFLSNPRLEIKQTRDFDLIKSIIFHPDIAMMLLDGANFDKVSDGLDDENKKYYVYYCNNIPAGIVVFLDFKKFEEHPDTYFVDIGVLKAYRGKVALDLSRVMLSLFFKNNKISRLLCVVNVNNQGCVVFCKKLGFKIIERNDKYFLFEFDREKLLEGKK